MLMRFKEAPDQSMISAASAKKVMHVSMRTGETIVMASDGRCTGQTAFKGISLSLTVSGTTEAERLLAALQQGGEVIMSLATTFFASKFGTLADKFGVNWMVMCPT